MKLKNGLEHLGVKAPSIQPNIQRFLRFLETGLVQRLFTKYQSDAVQEMSPFFFLIFDLFKETSLPVH